MDWRGRGPTAAAARPRPLGESRPGMEPAALSALAALAATAWTSPEEEAAAAGMAAVALPAPRPETRTHPVVAEADLATDQPVRRSTRAPALETAK